MTDPTHDDLDWQAFRYVAAEMSPDELARFEERLADDQASREAVARAVELADALAIVSADRELSTDLIRPTLHRPDRSSWWTRVGWIGVGAAATLACVFLFHAMRLDPEPTVAFDGTARTPADSLSSDNEEATELARLWCRTRDELETTDDGRWPLPDPLGPSSAVQDGTAQATAGEAPEGTDIIGSDDNLPGDTGDMVEAVPSWMLAALAGEADGFNDGLPEPEGP